jgi:hypothetical protein
VYIPRSAWPADRILISSIQIKVIKLRLSSDCSCRSVVICFRLLVLLSLPLDQWSHPIVAMPGKTHDLTAARLWGILGQLQKAGIFTLADKAYQGAEATTVITSYKGKNKPQSQKLANRSHAKLRGPGERANAQLKSWRILRKLRCSPSKAGHLVKAIAVLQNHRAAQAARG